MAKNNAPRILMCRPKHFGVTYAINPWMDPKSWASEAKSLTASARREWRGLHARLKDLGAEIAHVPPEPGLPDLVFTANSAVVMDGKALLARFRHPERQGEEPVFARAFERLRDKGAIAEIHTLPDGVFMEGAGDCVFDAGRRAGAPPSRRRGCPRHKAAPSGSSAVRAPSSRAAAPHRTRNRPRLP